MFPYESLRTAKSTKGLGMIVREGGLDWTDKQVELYALLDPTIYANQKGEWIVQQDERRQMILSAIEKAIGYRPMTKINPDVMAHIPAQYTVLKIEVIEVALSTGRYESPKENILRVKR